MDDLRSAKLMASSVLAGAGAISISLGEISRGGGVQIGILLGAVLLISGGGLLARQ